MLQRDLTAELRAARIPAPHELRERVFRAVLGVALQQRGIVRHDRTYGIRPRENRTKNCRSGFGRQVAGAAHLGPEG